MGPSKVPTGRLPHIAFFLRCAVGGGAERVTINLANSMAARGLDVEFVCAQGNGVLLRSLAPSVRVVNLDCRWLGLALPRLVRYLRKRRPDGLMAGLHYPSEIAIAAKYLARVQTQVVVTEHNTLSIDAARSPERSARWVPQAVRWLYPHADRVVAVSEGVADDLAKTAGLARSRIETIYNPIINSELFAKARAPVPHPWLTDDREVPVVLGVGRLMPQKDFGMLLRAIARVTALRPVRAIILGEGRERRTLERLRDRLGLADSVAFVGFQENPMAYLARADAFALSSQWEGFGNVLAEALALGTPVVSTDCPHGPSEILAGGRYGRLVPPGNDRTMAGALLDAIAQGRQDYGDEAVDRFCCERVTDRYLQLMGLSELALR